MGLLEFTAAPVDLNKKTQKAKRVSQPAAKKEAKERRRKVESNATVFGDELFQQAYKPAKAIVVKFHPFTLTMVRMEVEGRFAIQYFSNAENKLTDNKFLLYRFFNPIEYEYKEDDYKIELSENVKTYGPFEHVESIRNKILEILKREMLEEREKNKKFAADTEKTERLAREKAQDEAEKLAEQLSSTRKPEHKDSDNRETKIESAQSPQEEKIHAESIKEEIHNDDSSDQIRKPTTDFLTETNPIVMDALKEADNNKIVTLMKRENKIIKFVTKMPKSKAQEWIASRPNYYILEK